MNTDSENILDKHCNTQFDSVTGEEEILSSKSSVLIAMEEYAKQEIDSSEKLPDDAKNIRQLKKIINSSISEYYETLLTEIRLVGLREKIENRVATLTKIKEILNKHKD